MVAEDGIKTNEILRDLAPEDRRRGMLLELITVLSVAVLPLAFTSIRAAIGREAHEYTDADYRAAVLSRVLHCLIGLLLVVYVVYQRRESVRRFGWSVRPAVIPWSLLLFILAMAAYTGACHLVNLTGLVRVEHAGEDLTKQFSQRSGRVYLLLILIGPIFEETIVRAYLMIRVSDLGWSPAWAVLVSSFVQASYHVHKGLAFAPGYIAIFLVFSLYFARYRNLPVVILAHLYIDIAWWGMK